MTTRELYRNTLIELNKEEAVALYLEDFLYFANKAVSEYTNIRYGMEGITQQLGDDLKDLRSDPEVIIPGEKDNLKTLSKPYRHLLNCIVTVKLNSYIIGCDQDPGTTVQYAAKRLTADRKAAILNNVYLEPKFYRPYYDIKGNTLFIKTGEDGNYTVEKVEIEYLFDPDEIKLKEEDLLVEEDNSPEMQFSLYVNMEIIKVIVKLILEQGTDQRLMSNQSVNQTVGPFPSGK
jgi:hypothetical protein